MSVLVLVEVEGGAPKKSSLEALTYAHKVASNTGGSVTALVLGSNLNNNGASLGNYGVSKVLQVSDSRLNTIQLGAYATAVVEAAKSINATWIILSRSAAVDAIAGRIGARLNAATVTNVTELPSFGGETTVKRGVFTGKAYATVALKGATKLLTITKNAAGISEVGGSASVEAFSPNFSESDFSIKTTGVTKAEGDILLTDADVVVSGGRGLKGPENWNLVLDLAKNLKAGTACSKPVSDLDWRPHHEHVGQTGVKVAPNLYIAIGISGAIQHIAGISSSRCIVAINSDPEAPIFKAADYGIIGNAFEIVPKLIASSQGLR